MPNRQCDFPDRFGIEKCKGFARGPKINGMRACDRHRLECLVNKSLTNARIKQIV